LCCFLPITNKLTLKNQTRTIRKRVSIKRNASTRICDVAEPATTSFKHCGTPSDAVYLKDFRFGCPFCRKTGTTKAYKNLWKLRIHFYKDHGYGFSCQNLMATLVDLIERKVIL
jgi:hypothetical protein